MTANNNTDKYGFWLRFEPHSREEGDFSNGLRATIHDPAWMLARQWQLGEFQGEDVGSPIIVNMSVKEDRISRVLGGDDHDDEQHEVIYDENIPLEVYAEPLNLEVSTQNNDGSLTFQLDLKTRVRLGLHFEIELSNALSSLVSSTVAEGFVKYLASPAQKSIPSLSFEDLNEKQEDCEMDITKKYLALIQGRVIDIYKIFDNPDAIAILKRKASEHFGPRFSVILVTTALQRAFNSLKYWWNGEGAGSRIGYSPQPPATPTSRPHASASDLQTPFFQLPSLVSVRKHDFSSSVSDAKDDRLNSSSLKSDIWNHKRLDYNFAVQFGLTHTEKLILDASEYKEMNLDWYSFTVSYNNSFQGSLKSQKQVIPSNLKFLGMPEKRWWNLEDSYINFGSITPKTNNIATMLLMEFCLVQSPDWYIVPHTLKVGTISQIDEMKVKDVFGDETLIKAAGRTDRELSISTQGKSEDIWSMYVLSKKTVRKKPESGHQEQPGNNNTSYFFLPSISNNAILGDTVEHINFLRDETANLVWAVEKKYRTYLGEPVSGYDHYIYRQNRALSKSTGDTANKVQSGNANSTKSIPYTLVTSVPWNWIPFIPVNTNDITLATVPDSEPLGTQIALQRAAMIDPSIRMRSVSSSASTLEPVSEPSVALPILPNSRILTEVPSPYFIDESEVPRIGSIVSEVYRRVVGSNGRVFLWLSRKKSTGSGEGSSGLTFDYIPIKASI